MHSFHLLLHVKVVEARKSLPVPANDNVAGESPAPDDDETTDREANVALHLKR